MGTGTALRWKETFHESKDAGETLDYAERDDFCRKM